MKRNGYRPSHRNRWLLLQKGIISREVLLFWEYCLDQMLFDKRNPGYGTAKIDFDEAMSVFRVTSPTSVRTWYNKLVILGLVRVIDGEKHVLEIVNCERYIHGGNGKVGEYEEREYDQSIDVITQSIGFCRQSADTKNHPTDVELPTLLKRYESKGLSSFKVDLGSNPKQTVRTMEEYQAIYQEGGYSLLSPEDMMWIDQNQKFDKPIISKEMKTVADMSDQEIDDIFMRGKYV